MSSAPENSCRKYFLANQFKVSRSSHVRQVLSRLRHRNRGRLVLGQAGTCPKMFISIMSSGTSITIQLGRRQSHKIMRSHCGAAKIKEETTLLLHGLWGRRRVRGKTTPWRRLRAHSTWRDHCVTSWKLNQQDNSHMDMARNLWQLYAEMGHYEQSKHLHFRAYEMELCLVFRSLRKGGFNPLGQLQGHFKGGNGKWIFFSTFAFCFRFAYVFISFSSFLIPHFIISFTN